MSIVSHNPVDYIRNLQQLLASDKKIIGFLFGAGTSLVKNPKTDSPYVPAIAKMTQLILEEIKNKPEYNKAIDELRIELDGNFTVETLLSRLELKKQAVGKGKLNGLDQKGIENLIASIKEEVHKLASVHNDIDCDQLVHTQFANWIGRANRQYGVEIFTTNYDYLFEVALENCSIPYYDGFAGSYKPFFDAESVEDLHYLCQRTKLWKIHGSLGWHYDIDSRHIIRSSSDKSDILIYPSALKYDQSRKQPYTALGDRLSAFVKKPDTVLLVAGYSFGDDHINERLNTALVSNPRGHIYVLYYDRIIGDGKISYSFTEDCQLAKLAKSNTKISVFAIRSAVIGGVYGKWRLKNEPDKNDSINIDIYYDEDACCGPADGGKELIWTGEGCLKIPDFSDFVRFLSSMIYDHSDANIK